jgi:MFS family permease
VGGETAGHSAVRSLGAGALSGARGTGRALRHLGQRIVRFTTSNGADRTGLARLIHLQFFVAAGDAAVAVSLAGTLFFTVPTEQARPQVAQFLLLTMAPFAVVAPFIGPFLDRFRHGRRWAIGVTLSLRAFLCWLLADAMSVGSRWVFLYALGCLVASKAYTVTRASAVPRLLPPAFTLVNANSRISMANVAGAAVGGGVAAAIARVGPEWSLRLAFVVFVGATVVAILLSPRVDSTVGERDIQTMRVLTGTQPTDVSAPPDVGAPAAAPAAVTATMAGPTASSERIQRRFRSLQPGVVHGLRCVMGARLMTGFLTMFLAFLVREQPIGSVEGTTALAVVVTAAGIGNSLGTVAGNLLKDRSPEMICLSVLALDVAMALTTAGFYSIYTVVALGLCAGMCAQLAKLSYDALVQRDVPEVVRTSVFARSETVFQICWVFGGGLGIALPLISWLGFGLIASLLLALLVWTVVAWRKRLHVSPVTA